MSGAGPGVNVTVVKIGGALSEEVNLLTALADEIGALTREGGLILLVHGGGGSLSELSRRFGYTPRFVEGLRETSPEEMVLADMALAGGVNKRLVRLLESRGVAAWGFSGSDGRTIIGECLGGAPDRNRTAGPAEVSTKAVRHLWAGGWVPVLAPVSTDSGFLGVNINADDAATAMAEALEGRHLIFFSDVPGVLRDGKVIRCLTPGDAEELTAEGVISGGMIPKVRSALRALEEGVGAVHIAAYGRAGDLRRAIEGKHGTEIARENDAC